jgi:POT family proton-dependent oligopeptide transporter
MIMWEFFAFYGLKSILVLFLTNSLHFSDSAAYQLFGSFISLVFITPIVGGWLADRYCGYRHATAVGCILIIIGSFILAECPQNIFIGLALLAMGIGFFKSNAVCMISNCYVNDPAGATSAFSLYYVSGNLGSFLAQMCCPYLVEQVSWKMGFMIASIGMLLGFVMLIISKSYFSWEEKTAKMKEWHDLSLFQQLLRTVIIVLGTFIPTYLILRHNSVGYLLCLAVVAAFFIFLKIYRDADAKRKKLLLFMVLLTCFATSYWIFSNQIYSSYPLFITRYVNRSLFGITIPTGMYQSLNSMSVLFAGTIMTFGWRWMERHHFNPRADSKLSVALILLVLGFVAMTFAATLANHYTPIAMWFPALSICLISMAEAFLDPVLLAVMGDAAPHNTEGRLVAIYYLFIGAIGNYLSIWVSKLTVDPTTSVASTSSFHAAYLQASEIAVGLFALLLLCICWRKYSERRALLSSHLVAEQS